MDLQLCTWDVFFSFVATRLLHEYFIEASLQNSLYKGVGDEHVAN